MLTKLTYLVPFILALSLVLTSGAKGADPNLIGWWPLNEGSGDIAFDLSGSGNDGTILRADSGGLAADGSVWFMDPDHGMVVSFNGDDGTGAYITTDLIIPALGLTDDFTWAFWAKQHADQATNNDTILGNRYGGTQSPLQFCKFTPTRFEFYNDDGNYEQGINYDPVPSDVWVHHAVTKDGADLTYYRNGEVAMTNTLTKTMDENPFYMGGDAQPAELWKGYLSDVRLYNRALTKLEILAAMKGVERIDMEVGFALQPPVIDGEVDYVWEGASTESFVPLEDPADGSGTWKVLYDAENLYVIVDVTDDSLQNDSASSWQDDSVEIYFDGGNTKLSTPLSGDDHQYTFGWTADDIQGTNIAGYTEGIEQAQVTTDTGWRIEVKMPWLSIQGVAAQAGDLIGIDCYYNDDDDGGDSREGKMLSLSAEEFWNNASGWGTAVLGIIPEPVDPGAEGLVAYYALDNDVLDGSGNGNDGVITDNPDFVDPTWIDGVVGGALEIHGDTSVYGSANHVQVPNSDSLDIAGSISIALWIRPDADDPEGKGANGGETAPMAKALSGINPWNWQVRYGWGGPSPYMSFTFNTSPRAWASVGQNLTQGEWAHIACSHDGETLKCYLNGVETDSTPMGAIATGEAPVLIGSDGWGCDWIGAIDEVAIYNRGLSDGEILYLAGYLPMPIDPGTENLVAYYPLDNDANDASGNNNHGTPSGEPQWVVGQIGGALEFDGVDDHVDCGNDPSLDITGPITIAAWVYPTGSGSSSYPRIVDKSDGTGGADPGYKLYLRSADNYLVTLSAGGVFLNSSISATLDDWNYVAFVTDGTQRKLFLNGVWEVWDESALPVSSSNPLFIGDSPAGSRPFNGFIDEVTIYNRALSEPEVRFIAGEK